MLEWIQDAIGTLAQRIGKLEGRPWNPYSPDCQMFDHFAGDGTIDSRWTASLVLTGAVTIPNATPTIARLATGATANSTAQLDWGANYSLVGMDRYVDVVARFAVTTAIDADDIIFASLATGVEFITIGVRGASSTGFYVCRTSPAGGLNTITTVPIDTAQHLFRIQTFPDRVRFYIDSVFVAEHTTNLPTATAMQPRLVASNGANGGSRTMDCDFIWVRENVAA